MTQIKIYDCEGMTDYTVQCTSVFLISIEVKYTLNEVMIEHVWLAG